MNGKLIPIDLTSATYTDSADQDWSLLLDLTNGTVAARLKDTPNQYSRSTGEVLARSDSFEHAAAAIDQWVNDWNAGGNPAPVLTVDAKPKGGSMWPVLLLVAFVLFSGKGKRR